MCAAEHWTARAPAEGTWIRSCIPRRRILRDSVVLAHTIILTNVFDQVLAVCRIGIRLARILDHPDFTLTAILVVHVDLNVAYEHVRQLVLITRDIFALLRPGFASIRHLGVPYCCFCPIDHGIVAEPAAPSDHLRLVDETALYLCKGADVRRWPTVLFWTLRDSWTNCE